MGKMKWILLSVGLLVLVICLFGCKQHVKITPIKEYTCQDDDGGLNHYAKGETILNSEVKIDYCLDNQNLMEFYCEDDQIRNKTYSCSCKNGKCEN